MVKPVFAEVTLFRERIKSDIVGDIRVDEFQDFVYIGSCNSATIGSRMIGQICEYIINDTVYSTLLFTKFMAVSASVSLNFSKQTLKAASEILTA